MQTTVVVTEGMAWLAVGEAVLGLWIEGLSVTADASGLGMQVGLYARRHVVLP